MDRRTATRLSKFLSLVLRHRPDEYGLRMDELGFVDFESLIDVIVAEDILGKNAEEEVQKLVEGSDRRRFEISEGRIRALYGHSARVNLALLEDDPPPTLFHGTSGDRARVVSREGLLPSGRAYVHLSATEEEALAVGGRHAENPVLLEIDTAAARERGITFHRATDLIWLCPALPVEVLRVPEFPPTSQPRREAPPPETPRPSAPSRSAGQSSGIRRLEPDPEGGFKRRTRKRQPRR
jgi:putative RNA 2'-phosphotransferase